MIQFSGIGERDGCFGVDDRVDSNDSGDQRITYCVLRPGTPDRVVREDVEQYVGVDQKHSVVPAREPHHIIGTESSVRDAACVTEALLDESSFAQHGTNQHSTVGLFEGRLRIGEQSELQPESLGDRHLTLGCNFHCKSITNYSLTIKSHRVMVYADR